MILRHPAFVLRRGRTFGDSASVVDLSLRFVTARLLLDYLQCVNDDPIAGLAYARILPPGQLDVFHGPAEALENILVAGECYPARTRTWRFGGVRPGAEVIAARLGYQSSESTKVWNEAEKDFRREAVRNGQAVSFVLRLADFTIVYERPRGKLSDHQFVRGFQHVLRSADRPQLWTVALLDTKATFEDWAQQIDVVQRFSYRAEVASIPSGPQSPILDTLLRPHAERVTIDWRASTGVDVNDHVLQELARVASAGIGQASAVGRKNGLGDADQERAWTSATSAERIVREVAVDPTTGEVAKSSFLAALADVPLGTP
jgi:hypothetical protein